MNTFRRNLVAALVASACALGAASGTALAQEWPARPIRVIVPFPPGGGTDMIARETTHAVSQATGWKFIVENKPGAGGNLGVDAAAKAAPDGYTLVLGQTSNLSINPTLYPKLPYDPVKDLAPIALVARAPLVMVTGTQTPYKTLTEAIAAAKAKPQGLNFASPGNGTVAHLSSEMLQNTAGFKTAHVPYKGVAQALSDVVSGTVDFYMSSVPTLIGQIRLGKLRALAVTSLKRVDDLPDVPTIAESGYPGFEADTWFGFLAPAGTSEAVITRLNAEFNKALATKELGTKLREQGAEPANGSPADFGKLIVDGIEFWGKAVRDSGAKVQ